MPKQKQKHKVIALVLSGKDLKISILWKKISAWRIDAKALEKKFSSDGHETYDGHSPRLLAGTGLDPLDLVRVVRYRA